MMRMMDRLLAGALSLALVMPPTTGHAALPRPSTAPMGFFAMQTLSTTAGEFNVRLSRSAFVAERVREAQAVRGIVTRHALAWKAGTFTAVVLVLVIHHRWTALFAVGAAVWQTLHSAQNNARAVAAFNAARVRTRSLEGLFDGVDSSVRIDFQRLRRVLETYPPVRTLADLQDVLGQAGLTYENMALATDALLLNVIPVEPRHSTPAAAEPPVETTPRVIQELDNALRSTSADKRLQNSLRRTYGKILFERVAAFFKYATPLDLTLSSMITVNDAAYPALLHTIALRQSEWMNGLAVVLALESVFDYAPGPMRRLFGIVKQYRPIGELLTDPQLTWTVDRLSPHAGFQIRIHANDPVQDEALMWHYEAASRTIVIERIPALNSRNVDLMNALIIVLLLIHHYQSPAINERLRLHVPHTPENDEWIERLVEGGISPDLTLATSTGSMDQYEGGLSWTWAFNNNRLYALIPARLEDAVIYGAKVANAVAALQEAPTVPFQVLTPHSAPGHLYAATLPYGRFLLVPMKPHPGDPKIPYLAIETLGKGRAYWPDPLTQFILQTRNNDYLALTEASGRATRLPETAYMSAWEAAAQMGNGRSTAQVLEAISKEFDVSLEDLGLAMTTLHLLSVGDTRKAMAVLRPAKSPGVKQAKATSAIEPLPIVESQAPAPAPVMPATSAAPIVQIAPVVAAARTIPNPAPRPVPLFIRNRNSRSRHTNTHRKPIQATPPTPTVHLAPMTPKPPEGATPSAPAPMIAKPVPSARIDRWIAHIRDYIHTMDALYNHLRAHLREDAEGLEDALAVLRSPALREQLQRFDLRFENGEPRTLATALHAFGRPVPTKPTAPPAVLPTPTEPAAPSVRSVELSLQRRSGIARLGHALHSLFTPSAWLGRHRFLSQA